MKTSTRRIRSSLTIGLSIVPALGLLAACGSDTPARPTGPGSTALAAPSITAADPTADLTRTTAEARRLLARGNEAFRAGKLFEPAGDSAVDHFAAAIALEPDDPAVREAVSDLLPLALARAEAVIVRGRREDAATLLDRIDGLAPGSPAVVALRGRLAAALRADAEAAARQAAAETAAASTDAAEAPGLEALPIAVDAIAIEVPAVRPVDLAEASRR